MKNETFEIQRLQVALIKRCLCRPEEPPIFSGNILAYLNWVLAFGALIEREAVSLGHKFCYLGQYTSHQLQKIIDGLFGVGRQILHERFSDPLRFTRGVMKGLSRGQYATKLQSFRNSVTFWQQCNMKIPYCPNHLKEIDTFSAIQDLARLTPQEVVTKCKSNSAWVCPTGSKGSNSRVRESRVPARRFVI